MAVKKAPATPPPLWARIRGSCRLGARPLLGSRVAMGLKAGDWRLWAEIVVFWGARLVPGMTWARLRLGVSATVLGWGVDVDIFRDPEGADDRRLKLAQV